MFFINRVAASWPVVTSNATNLCLLAGQPVSLTCRVTYNGTNLMPMVMRWYSVDYIYYEYNEFNGSATVNTSSVYESSLIFTATGEQTDNYRCGVQFLSPTGIVIRGVERQYSNIPNSYRSEYYASKRIASAFY